jgi:hypothetical protein
MQGTPEGFPSGIPGMGDDIEGAMQQAPQFSRHFTMQLIIKDGAKKVKMD